MTPRTLAACALFSFVFLADVAYPQPGDRKLDMKAQVLDILFPLDASGGPFLFKMVLRFGDSNTQLVVLAYPGGRSELIRYSLNGTTRGELSQLIQRMVGENPEVKPQEIAARLKVAVDRSPIDEKALTHAVDQLKALRISPVLASRVVLGTGSEYEFWYDTYQELVRYTIVGPFQSSPQDQLVEWMIQFRATIPSLIKGQLAPKR